MSTLRAFMHHYDDREPQILDIPIRDKRTTKFRSVQITRTELERACPEKTSSKVTPEQTK